MNLYRQNNTRRNKRRLLFATVLVGFVFIIDGLSGGNIRSMFRAGASSVLNVGTRIGSTISGSGLFSSRRALESENRTLREERAELQMRAAAFAVLREENEALRNLVHLAEEEQGITAPVISSFRSSPYGTFLIGAGTEDGARPGSLVLVGDPRLEAFVLGRIQTSDTHSSLVKSLFAPGEVTDAVIAKVGVSVEGRGGGQARAEAPREASITEGDPVISGTFGGRGIGVVGKVVEEAGGASQTVFIRFPINLNEVRFVYVLPTQQ